MYGELFFAVTLPLNCNEADKGTVYDAEATPDHSGANDSRSFSRSAANKGAESPNSSMFVKA